MNSIVSNNINTEQIRQDLTSEDYLTEAKIFNRLYDWQNFIKESDEILIIKIRSKTVSAVTVTQLYLPCTLLLFHLDFLLDVSLILHKIKRKIMQITNFKQFLLLFFVFFFVYKEIGWSRLRIGNAVYLRIRKTVWRINKLDPILNVLVQRVETRAFKC